MAAWILYVLGTGTLIAVAALAIDGILRRTNLPTRWVWVAALAGIAVLAVVAPRSETQAPQRTAGVVVTASRMVPTTPGDPGVLAQLASLRGELASAVTAGMASVQRGAANLEVPLLLAWMLVSGVLLSLLVIITRRAEQVRIRWPRAEVRGVNVRVAPSTGPAVMGVARPDIVLPGWLMTRPEDEQHLVVVHEREHVAARDQLLPLGAWVVAALLPWHPAVWWCMSRLRLAIELDCDARVLHRGVPPRSYGSLLIDIAGQCAGHRIGALALADRPSHLERRLLAMKQSSRRIGFARATTLAAIAGAAVLMACEARIPTAAEVDNMDVAAVERAATQAKLIQGSSLDSARFYVNEVRVSEAEAKQLTAKKIATVNISKVADGKEIRIATIDSMNPAALRPTMLLERKMQRDSVSVKELEATGLRMKSSMKTKLDAQVYIDGVKASPDALAKLKANLIESVEVIKGASAARIYGSDAAETGVISVKTKAP